LRLSKLRHRKRSKNFKIVCKKVLQTNHNPKSNHNYFLFFKMAQPAQADSPFLFFFGQQSQLPPPLSSLRTTNTAARTTITITIIVSHIIPPRFPTMDPRLRISGMTSYLLSLKLLCARQ